MKLKNKFVLIGIGILIALFSLFLFGFTGLKTIVGIFLLFFLPFYLILDNFDLRTDEKAIFSLFIGLGIYSSFVYLFGLVLGSIKISMIIVFVILIAVSFLIKRFKGKKIEEHLD